MSQRPVGSLPRRFLVLGLFCLAFEALKLPGPGLPSCAWRRASQCLEGTEITGLVPFQEFKVGKGGRQV